MPLGHSALSLSVLAVAVAFSWHMRKRITAFGLSLLTQVRSMSTTAAVPTIKLNDGMAHPIVGAHARGHSRDES